MTIGAQELCVRFASVLGLIGSRRADCAPALPAAMSETAIVNLRIISSQPRSRFRSFLRSSL